MATIPRIAAAAALVAVAAAALASSSTQAQRLAPYVSDLHFTPGAVDGIVLTDPARGGYRIPLLVRYPIGATDRRPIVIWNHGGRAARSGARRWPARATWSSSLPG